MEKKKFTTDKTNFVARLSFLTSYLPQIYFLFFSCTINSSPVQLKLCVIWGNNNEFFFPLNYLNGELARTWKNNAKNHSFSQEQPPPKKKLGEDWLP